MLSAISERLLQKGTVFVSKSKEMGQKGNLFEKCALSSGKHF